VKRDRGFWDASALVPVCVEEDASQFVRQHLRRYAPIAWWGSSIEVYSAICRLYRRKEINDRELLGAATRLQALKEAWNEILPGEDLRNSAERLLEKHRLRAGGSLQLAAALVWCGGRPAKRVFVCADERLLEAARAEGFAVVELPKAGP
jgi:predicted nucleic acid-binding protein